MAEFGWQELAALFAGLLIVGGSVAWGLRHSRWTIAALQGDVAAFDAVLRALETAELRTNTGPVYEHPMVGTLPSHSTLVGTLHGFAIHVDLLDPHGDAERYPEYVVRIRVTAPLGQAFEGARDSSSCPAFDPHSKAFQTQVDGRSLVVTETPTRTSTISELRRSAPSLGNEKFRSVPLIVTSTGSGEEAFQAHRRLRTRARDYVAKPVSPDQMLTRIALQLPDA